jgi:hypothetical protein
MAKGKTAPDSQLSAKPGAALTITPQVDAAMLQTLQLNAEAELAAFGLGFVIEDAATAEVIAAELTAELGRFDAIEAMRTTATGPLNALKRTIDGWFKPGKEKSQALISLYKSALSAWFNRLNAEKEAALLTAATAAQAGDVQGLTQALNVVNAPTQLPTGTSYVQRWKARVCDMQLFASYAAQQNRWDLLQVNDSGLQKLAAGSAQPPAFPGVTFEQDTQVRASHG